MPPWTLLRLEWRMAKRGKGRQKQQQLDNRSRDNTSRELSLTGTYSEKRYVMDLPDPEDVAKFEQLYEGATEIIFEQYQKQGNHRRQMEAKVIEGNVAQQKWAPIIGLVIVLVAIGAGVFLTLRGFDASGLAAIITALAAPVAVFLGGRIMQYFERKEKR